jgi:hypothetical protein
LTDSPPLEPSRNRINESPPEHDATLLPPRKRARLSGSPDTTLAAGGGSLGNEGYDDYDNDDGSSLVKWEPTYHPGMRPPPQLRRLAPALASGQTWEQYTQATTATVGGGEREERERAAGGEACGKPRQGWGLGR